MTPLVLCTLTIIVTLLASGIAKAKDRASTAAAIVNLKLDRLLPLKFVSRFLPWGEIALALWLLVVPGWPAILGGIASLVLFAAYWLVIARAVLTGNTASCNCFGGTSTAPISGYTLTRNTALLGAALGTLIATLDAHASALQVMIGLTGSGWLWILGALFIALALWAMYRSELLAPVHRETGPVSALESAEPAPAHHDYTHAADQEVIEEDYVRMPIPFGTLETSSGKQSFLELAQTSARILFFVSPGCGPCREVIPHIEKWQKQLPILKIHPVVADKDHIRQLQLPSHIEVLVDPGFTAQIAFGRATPLAVALGADGLLAGGPVAGSRRISEFMDDILEELSETVAENNQIS